MDPARASIVFGGILMLIVGIAHMFFYRIFDWRQVFAKVRVLDAQVFYTLHVALMLLGLGSPTCRCATPTSSVVAPGSRAPSPRCSLPSGCGAWHGRSCTSGRDASQVGRRWMMFHYGWIALFVMLTIAYSLPIAARLLG